MVTKDELLDEAAEAGVEVPEGATKADITALLRGDTGTAKDSVEDRVANLEFAVRSMLKNQFQPAMDALGVEI